MVSPPWIGVCARLQLGRRPVPGLLYRIAQVTGAVSGIAVPGPGVTAAALLTAAAGTGGCGVAGGQELLRHRRVGALGPGGPG